MINFINKRKREMSGFTLVETLVALFIFSVSILTVMSALSQGITSTIYAKDKIVAEYLSQEGIEYFRNIRDTAMLYATDKVVSWEKLTTQLNDSCGTTGCYFGNDENYFSVPPLTTGIITSCGGECPYFNYDSLSGMYNYNTGNKTTFSRTMRVEQAPDRESIKIISEVTFSAGSGVGAVSLSENLSNWIE